MFLGDSAFTASATMVPPFKCTAGGALSSGKSAFNALLSKPRVKSEHCIGTLKGRFPFLRSIGLRLASSSDMKCLIDCVCDAVVLHNFLLHGDTEEEWFKAIDEGDDDLDPEPTTAANQPDCTRRDELHCHLSELEGTNVHWD